MITKSVIENIYKQFADKHTTPDQLNLQLLFDYAMENHCLYVDDNNLIIESIEEGSPFHSIDLRRVRAILEFDRQIAIVLPGSIVFLNKKDDGVNVHIRMPKRSLMDIIREQICAEPHPEF